MSASLKPYTGSAGLTYNRSTWTHSLGHTKEYRDHWAATFAPEAHDEGSKVHMRCLAPECPHEVGAIGDAYCQPCLARLGL